MKRLVLLATLGMLLAGGVWGKAKEDEASFITVWDTRKSSGIQTVDGKWQTSDSTTIWFPAIGTNYAVAWRAEGEKKWHPVGNGRATTVAGKALSIKFPKSGRYEVKAGPEGLEGFQMFPYSLEANKYLFAGDYLRLIGVASWGDVEWSEHGLKGAFFTCVNLVSLPSLTERYPRARLVPKRLRGSLDAMFMGCQGLAWEGARSLAGWDVGEVTSMGMMFCNCTRFDADLSGWKTSKVRRMDKMFRHDVRFECDLSRWDVGEVRDMHSMFDSCVRFNSDLSQWDVGKVYNMRALFQYCLAFNSDLSRWNVARVEDMQYMFVGCGIFNSDLSRWDVGNVQDMSAMFSSCESLNTDLSQWNVGRVKDMQHMFNKCVNFNSDLSRWDVARVGDMSRMFFGCRAFNADLSQWNVSRVQVMSYMFYDCEKFDSDLSKWDVAWVRGMPEMFEGCKAFTSDLSGWKTDTLVDAQGMFLDCPLPKEKWPKVAEALGAGKTYAELQDLYKQRNGAGGDDGATEE
ncbi:MAG: BspA family leucine-rich repeat surface protein [Bacteroides sp.]